MTTSFVINLLRLVLTCNIVEFDKDLYLQMCGTAMGSACSPAYADIFMARLEEQFLDSISTYMKGKIFMGFFKRYLDDVFLLWQGSLDEFNEFLLALNGVNANIQFKCESDFGSRATAFLDTEIRITDGCLHSDLFVKPTAANQYLLPTSCHPSHISANIPFSLAYRLKRICSQEESFIKRLKQLKDWLLECKYKEKVIESAFTRVRKLTRQETLKKLREGSPAKQHSSQLMTPDCQKWAQWSKNTSRHCAWIHRCMLSSVKAWLWGSRDTATSKSWFAEPGCMTHPLTPRDHPEQPRWGGESALGAQHAHTHETW